MNFEKFLRTLFDGPERALFSSVVFREVFSESDIVLRRVKLF